MRPATVMQGLPCPSAHGDAAAGAMGAMGEAGASGAAGSFR